MDNLPIEAKRSSFLHCTDTINRTMLTLLSVGLYCLLTAIESPDIGLINSKSIIQTPIVNTSISFQGFLIVAPLILIVITIYLHIFFGEWLKLNKARIHHNNSLTADQKIYNSIECRWTLFSINKGFPRLLTAFIFYWFVPILLGICAWKACGSNELRYPIYYITLLFSFPLILLQINRVHEYHRFNLKLKKIILVSLSITAFISFFFPLIPGFLDRKSDFQGANLDNEKLAGSNLHNYNFQSANLSGSNLQETNLSNAILRKAILTNTNLQGANLSKADLMQANLTNANLQEANLIDAYLMNTNLSGAEFQDAKLQGAELEGADFKTAKNLDIDEIKKASNWSNAFYSEEILGKLGLPKDHNKILEDEIKKHGM